MQGGEKYLHAVRTFLLGTLDSGLCLLIRSVVHGYLVAVLSDIEGKVLQQSNKVSLIKALHQPLENFADWTEPRPAP